MSASRPVEVAPTLVALALVQSRPARRLRATFVLVFGALTPSVLAEEPLGLDALVEEATLVAADGATADWFGYAIALSRDTLVVGAYGDDIGATNNVGSVYVFARPSRGWFRATEVARLTASDAVEQDQFGRAVAISGDTIVVGAYGDDGYVGSAYVFVRPVTGWADATETAKLTASDRAPFDYFGDSVAIEGDTIVVGAPLDDDPIGDEGSAYVFVEPPGGWVDATEAAKLTATDGEVNDNLGASVAIGHGVIAAGAPGDDVAGQASAGSVLVFVARSGAWLSAQQTARLVASDGGAGDDLGAAVAASDDTIVAGSPGHDIGSNFDQGAAYVFVKPPEGWMDAAETAKLTVSTGDYGDELGTDVDIANRRIVVGAPDYDAGSGPQGAAFVFVEPPHGWVSGTERQTLTAAGGVSGDALGSAVAIDADSVAAASLYDDVGDVREQGSVTMFARGVRRDLVARSE